MAQHPQQPRQDPHPQRLAPAGEKRAAVSHTLEHSRRLGDGDAEEGDGAAGVGAQALGVGEGVGQRQAVEHDGAADVDQQVVVGEAVGGRAQAGRVVLDALDGGEQAPQLVGGLVGRGGGGAGRGRDVLDQLGGEGGGGGAGGGG
ncbi:2b733873-8a27-4520-a877-f787f815a20c [Thermothielavioides terrestris]|uniref:2b733873-8a27-4520-a877-f787f815a20c n=1 Tax=Thermothielavioides terrestris TaxID=2587410 RepID=A0A446B965_9PEZI|nr:2b733873-8a27-4520-a877-f787f815a20c [Thermothielavioides terrestris]